MGRAKEENEKEREEVRKHTHLCGAADLNKYYDSQPAAAVRLLAPGGQARGGGAAASGRRHSAGGHWWGQEGWGQT